ncbi:hypothetical protein [Sorangium sp. So ce131]
MRYEKPDFFEIKMDAEIGSYQSDFDPVPLFVNPAPAERAEDTSGAE